MIGLQITRITRPDPNDDNRVIVDWLIRAWALGHGCDATVKELNPPYTTPIRGVVDGKQRLDIVDGTRQSIAHTEWAWMP